MRFLVKTPLFESIPCIAAEHYRIQTVDNHITHATAPCAVLYPLTVKCANTGVCFFFSFFFVSFTLVPTTYCEFNLT